MSDSQSPIVRGPNDGEQIYAGGDKYRFLAVKDETNGSYGLWEAIVPPGGGPPPHLHRNEEEGFYIVEGAVTMPKTDKLRQLLGHSCICRGEESTGFATTATLTSKCSWWWRPEVWRRCSRKQDAP